MNGVKARALIDTGAGSSYISTYLIKKLNSKPLRKAKRLIQQMYGTVEKIAEIHKIKITSSVTSVWSFHASMQKRKC